MINLPELCTAIEQSPAVTIRFGNVPLSLDNPLRSGTKSMERPGQILLFFGNEGRYLINDGQEIIIDVPSDIDEKSVRFHVLGPCLRALLGQQGLLVLHANVVLINGNAVAMAGEQKSGKSTLTAFLYQANCPLIGDDLCAVFVKNGIAYVHPGIPRFKLWEDSLRALGKEPHSSHFIHHEFQKYALSADKSISEPVQLSEIIILKKGEHHKLTRLTGMHALSTLGKQTFYRRSVKQAGVSIPHFDRLSELAKIVPIYEFTRPWDINRLPETASWLMQAYQDNSELV